MTPHIYKKYGRWHVCLAYVGTDTIISWNARRHNLWAQRFADRLNRSNDK